MLKFAKSELGISWLMSTPMTTSDGRITLNSGSRALTAATRVRPVGTPIKSIVYGAVLKFVSAKRRQTLIGQTADDCIQGRPPSGYL
jgi:hypothetical protein